MFKIICFLAVVYLLSRCADVSGDEWKAATGPLMTRWAKNVSPDNVHPEYPRPQMVRERWLSLNGLWDINIEGKQSKILVPFPIESALSGVMHHGEQMTYRRTFEVPKDWAGQRVLLHFGAVDWEAAVMVNEKEVGRHRGGYDPFSFDITDALVPEGPQQLVVAVFDPTNDGDQPRGKQVLKPEGIWYTLTSGIWQTVWLEPVPEAYIRSIKLTPDVAENALWVEVDVAGDSSGVDAHAEVRFSVEDKGDGATSDVSGVRGPVAEKLRISFPKSHQIKRWNPDSPNLHELRVRLIKGGVKPHEGETIDSVGSYFGMRKVELRKDDAGVNRIFLNNQPLFQIGLLDQGFWPDGLYTAPTDEALRYDLEMTKKLGFNMARKHVKVEPARWYYWCDKLGILVWQDMPSGDNKTPEAKKQFEEELKQLIETHRNSPSIIMWVVFNEGWGQHDTERLTKMVMELDSSRLVNNASGWTDANVGHVIDMHKYPGPSMPSPEPARAAVLGEFGGLGLFLPEHAWTDKQLFSYRGLSSADELNEQYVRLLSQVWDLEDQGLSAAVYTQTTDVEVEINGLMTYDRQLKVDAERIAAANRGEVPR